MKKVIILFSILLSLMTHAESRVIPDSEGMDCHVYLPATIDPAKTYQLVVGVHGYRGKGNGAAGMAKWAERGDVIVIGPSFKDSYQMGNGDHAKKLIALFKQLSKEYKLNEKMFIHGFSGGSQFAHRFTMNHPKYVCGVSAHSGGSWATDGYGEISMKAKKIPFAISCGEKDTKLSTPDSKFSRLDWYKRFRDEIDKKNFCYAGGIWPGFAHRQSPQATDLMRQCFQLATGLPGGADGQKIKISDDWKNLDNIESADTASTKKSTAPSISNSLKKLIKSAAQKANQGKVPDDKLVAFMTKYPPVLWSNEPDTKTLLNQCTQAAVNWRSDAIKAGKYSDQNRRKFAQFSKGLTIPELAESQ